MAEGEPDAGVRRVAEPGGEHRRSAGRRPSRRAAGPIATELNHWRPGRRGRVLLDMPHVLRPVHVAALLRAPGDGAGNIARRSPDGPGEARELGPSGCPAPTGTGGTATAAVRRTSTKTDVVPAVQTRRRACQALPRTVSTRAMGDVPKSRNYARTSHRLTRCGPSSC